MPAPKYRITRFKTEKGVKRVKKKSNPKKSAEVSKSSLKPNRTGISYRKSVLQNQFASIFILNY
jgi:hypothetical protein